jgi:hypothetical protein
VNDVMTIGVDLAKNVIRVHGVDQRGQVVLKKQLPRGRFVAFFVHLATSLVGMESCASAQYWARQVVFGRSVYHDQGVAPFPLACRRSGR